MIDIISIGDTTKDVFLEGIQNVKTTKDKIILEYPTKLVVKEIEAVHLAGNAANVAVGSSRLGLKTAFYTQIGDDIIGKNIQEELKKENIIKKYIKIEKNSKTNYSVVLRHKSDRTILVHHVKRNYTLPKLEKSKWIYYTSIGEGYKKIEPKLIQHIRKNKIKLGYNPGSIHLKDVANCKKIIKHCETVFINKEEAQKILKTKENNIKKLLQKIKNIGVQIAIITDGPKGSYAYDGEKYYYQKIPKLIAKERTGSGDAYATGFIGALLNKKTIPEAMKWGTTNSTSVGQHIGPQEGLLKKTQLQKQIKKIPKGKIL